MSRLSMITGLAAALAMGAAGVAHADYHFSRSGPSGVLAGVDEAWTYDYDTEKGEVFWRSTSPDPDDPGGARYDGPQEAYGLVLTFSGGGPIDAASISSDTSAGCYGGDARTCFGGWKVSLLAPDTVQFTSQDPNDKLYESEYYYTDVFFSGAAPTSFTGSWITTYTRTSAAPEPGTWALSIAGVALAGAALRRRRRGEAHAPI